MLLSISLLFGMLIAWLVITAVCIALAIYRAVVGLREEEVLFIDPGEERLRAEQKVLAAKLEKLGRYLLVAFILSVVVGVATFGLWVYQQLK
ncbi:MAG: hypothetical protein HYY26_00625 [Acidobacteria bacterium]|nr:hypothetical protein [Acidobacteriota bacterium]